jgi:hypothetical protein
MCSTCSIDRLGPRSGCWPHDGEAAGGAVADSTLVIFRFEATMELGRSGRSMMMMSATDAALRPTATVRTFYLRKLLSKPFEFSIGQFGLRC